MRRLITIAMTLLVAGSLQAQNILQRFTEERITCKYDYSVTTPFVINYSGDAVVQGSCYHLTGNGLEIFSDGETRWTLDREAKEVYVENAEDVQNLLQNFLKLSKDIKDNGKEITGTFTDPEQDADVNFKISSITYAAASEDLAAFRFDTQSLDASYMVTDLR